MGAIQFFPLALAVLLVLPVVLAPAWPPLDRFTTRLAILLFGNLADTVSERRRQQRRANLRAAHMATTYRQYAAETGLRGLVWGVFGGIAGIYLMWGLFILLGLPEATGVEYLPDSLQFLAVHMGATTPDGPTLTAYNVGAGLLLGLLTAVSVIGYRWYVPRYVADERERQIDISMPMTVSFIYALSRSGMAFPQVMRILAENDHVYGHAAEEVGVAVRNIDVFGMDVVTAVQTMARRSPSGKFREFAENLSSVLQTGGSLSEFLHRQYNEYRQEAEAQQERLLELLATLAEAYVTLGVAGPLFLITLLVVIGITIGDALPILRLITYVVIPLGNLGFIVYLSTVVDNLSRRDPTEEEIEIAMRPEGVRRVDDVADEAGLDPSDAAGTAAPPRIADGGTDPGAEPSDTAGMDQSGTTGTDQSTDTGTDRSGAEDDDRDGRSGAGYRDTETVQRDRANIERLEAYKRFRELQRRLGQPIRTVIRRPTSLLWVTFPLAVFLVGIRLPTLIADGTLTVGELDDLLIQSLLFLSGTFAIAYEIHTRRIEAIERTIPDFLDRLASLNEAGMTVVESLRRVRGTELGALDDELDIVWHDIQWGADVETALKRFESRIRTESVSRVVTLMTEAMKASGNLGTVLRIAANQAKADRRLKRDRRQEMLTYLMVVYVAFFVFLFIVGVLNEVLIPSLPESSVTAGSGAGGETNPVPVVSQLGELDEAAYQQLFLHTAVIQGACSGLIGGQLSAGDVRNGAKHVTVLVAIGYVTFLLLL
ncbi:type II secretion protein F [Halobacteriales archaeon QS_8_69_26]|nr:MAG: type II secretion protein F [Halobacteriales archaeon QS_8_69_26]